MTDKSKAYIYTDNAEHYFKLNGHGKTKLTRDAALAVCDMLTEQGIYVVGVSGGHWRNPGYEEWPEYGWWRFPDRDGHLTLQENNEVAKQAIIADSDEADAFLIWEMK